MGKIFRNLQKNSQISKLINYVKWIGKNRKKNNKLAKVPIKYRLIPDLAMIVIVVWIVGVKRKKGITLICISSAVVCCCCTPINEAFTWEGHASHAHRRPNQLSGEHIVCELDLQLTNCFMQMISTFTSFAGVAFVIKYCSHFMLF